MTRLRSGIARREFYAVRPDVERRLTEGDSMMFIYSPLEVGLIDVTVTKDVVFREPYEGWR